MILFFSGGGRPWVAEVCLGRTSSIMLSMFVNVKESKPDSRLRRIFKAKKRDKSNAKS